MNKVLQILFLVIVGAAFSFLMWEAVLYLARYNFWVGFLILGGIWIAIACLIKSEID